MRGRAVLGASAVALLCAVAAGCGDYPHASPYDVDTPLSIQVVGPDSIHFGVDPVPIGYAMRTIPRTMVQSKWSGSGNISFQRATFDSVLVVPTQRGSATITVTVSHYAGSKTITIY